MDSPSSATTDTPEEKARIERWRNYLVANLSTELYSLTLCLSDKPEMILCLLRLLRRYGVALTTQQGMLLLFHRLNRQQQREAVMEHLKPPSPPADVKQN